MPGINLTHDEAVERSALVGLLEYVVRLDLSSADDADAPAFGVDATVYFAAQNAAAIGARTFLDFIGQIDQITFNGIHLPVSVYYDGARISLPPLAEQNRVTIRGRGRYVNTGQGLHRFLDPIDGNTYLYSQFAVADARRVFPVFDQPDIKGTLTLTMTVPAGWQALSNQAGARDTSDPTATVDTYDFPPTRPLSSYLYCVIAGPYHRASSMAHSATGREISMGVYCRASLAAHLEASEILDISRKGLAYYEEQFDYPYPFDKYDQVFVPEFNMGAMEHPGCVTFTDAYVFRGQVTAARRERRACTVLHEMAHMWFGDLVTMAWWDDLWLNESFATYMSTQAMADIDSGYSEQTWVTFAASEKWWAYRQDQLPSTHPIVAEIRDLEDVEVNFDGITYAKGASVLRQLVAYVGRAEFIAGVQAYLRAHQWRNATLADFLSALSQACGRDLSAWSQVWLEQAGVNTLRISTTTEAGAVIGIHLDQTAPADHPTLRPHRMLVAQPEVDGEFECIEVDLEDVGIDIRVNHWPTDRPIIPNAEDWTYAKLRFDANSWNLAMDQLPELADPLTVSLIWGTAWDMTRDAEMPAEQFVHAALRLLPTVANSTMTQAMLGQLTTAIERFTPARRIEDLRTETASALLELAEAADGDQRFQLVRAFATHASSPEQVQVLRGWYEGTLPLRGLAMDDDLRWDLLTALVVAGAADEGDIAALAAVDRTSSGQSSAALARAAIPHPNAKRRAWDSVVESDQLPNAIQRAVMTGLNRVRDPRLLTPFARRYFEVIEPIWANRTNKVAQMNVSGLYPWPLAGRVDVEADLVAATRAWLGRVGLPPALRRLVAEQLDDAERAVRARLMG